MTNRVIGTRRRADAGLTLIEVLVALAVVGVATGAMMIGVNAAGRDVHAQTEATRLAQTLILGVDEAMIARSSLALLWDQDGYRFVRWFGDDGWPDLASRFLSERHDLPAGLAMRGIGTDSVAPMVIRASGTGTAASFELSGSGASWIVDFDGFFAVARAGAAR